MHLKYPNVNDAFHELVYGIHNGHIPTVSSPSRVGDVLQIQEPVIVTYEKPLERVLFNPARDVNPFLNLYETLWMLAGRNDIAPLEYYSKNYGQFVDDGDGMQNAAYGYRWRHALHKEMGDPCSKCGESVPCHCDAPYCVDQLKVIIDHLRKIPTSRRVVLQMWNVEDDLLKIETTKDVACNLCALFSLRQASRKEIEEEAHNGYYLDMTVYNRSNDLTLGLLGANVVHFSFLQEYMANCLGVQVGVYNQVSNNLHCYTSRWEPDKWLAEGVCDEYRNQQWNHVPLVKDQQTFDSECRNFVAMNFCGGVIHDNRWEEPFLRTVAQPMMNAFHYHKHRKYWEALNHGVANIADGAWQLCAYRWIEKRRLAWEAKKETNDE
jgi:thymidylate synthase